MVSIEWRRVLKSKFLLIGAILVVLLPAVYGMIFVGSMWDPYGKVNQLPVAVVNQDETAQINGKQLKIGDELVTGMKKTKALDYHFVSEATAQNGLEKGKYYMVVTFPKDFSKNATTVLTKHPKQMVLKYDTAAGRNYIAEKMTSQAASILKEQVAANITKLYAQSILDSIHKTGQGMAKAADGSQQLANGGQKLADGSGKLTNGLDELNDQMLSFSNGQETLSLGLKKYLAGATELASGSQKVATGTAAFAKNLKKVNTGVQKLNQNSQQLNAGAKAAKNGTSELQTGSAQLTSGLNELAGKIDTTSLKQLQSGSSDFASNIAALSKAATAGATAGDPGLAKIAPQLAALSSGYQAKLNPGVQATTTGMTTVKTAITSKLQPGSQKVTSGLGKMTTGLQNLQTGLTTYTGGVAKLATGIGELNAQAPKLNNGAQQVASGLGTLTGSNGQLASGSEKLATGATALAAGTDKLGTGAKTLDTGLGKLMTGQNSLTDSLNSGADKLNAIPTKKANGNAVANPVAAKQHETAPVPNNGTAMAPYMLSVALWTGSIVLTTLFDVKRRYAQVKTAGQMWLSKFIILGPLAILQGLGIYLALHFIWGFNANHPVITVGILSLAALTYLSLITFLKLGLGPLGMLVALVYMFLQLSVAGGTYPVFLTTHFYQAVHPFVPMTYAVDALRHTISIGYLSQINGDVLILLASIIGLQVLVYLLYVRMFKHGAKTVVANATSDAAEAKELLGQD
ncbi:YhgE/Pip domain-containing protein [Periweissella cryptocerci]|uniref:YhgE/Pip domain-containing protein n=1 Tax=Periweissella cryptocerci TaxID=2506420 RepID=A0A4P6YRA4_9LACO|nr:YhgE/Pip domain-containing protein [Periweissella cryptocerci]QBO35141.1 YhgE/Pip domain-containing protein [Periweissella cryptocerci]